VFGCVVLSTIVKCYIVTPDTSIQNGMDSAISVAVVEKLCLTKATPNRNCCWTFTSNNFFCYIDINSKYHYVNRSESYFNMEVSSAEYCSYKFWLE